MSGPIFAIGDLVSVSKDGKLEKAIVYAVDIDEKGNIFVHVMFEDFSSKKVGASLVEILEENHS